jgi:hypothetical protein
MVWGGEKIYLGRGASIKIITSVCAPQQGWDGMDCVGVVWMTCSINRLGHQLGACWHSNMLLGLLGSVVHSENKYLSRHNGFTYNLIIYIGLGGCEWVDGIGWVRMTTSELGRCSSVLLLGSLGLVFHIYINVLWELKSIYIHLIRLSHLYIPLSCIYGTNPTSQKKPSCHDAGDG